MESASASDGREIGCASIDGSSALFANGPTKNSAMAATATAPNAGLDHHRLAGRARYGCGELRRVGVLLDLT